MKTLITERRLRQLASARSFQRGEEYAQHGRVVSLVENGAVLTATVRGTEEYQVRLEAADGELRHRCSCPMGRDGEFCKHAVAGALAWLHEQKPEPAGDAAIMKPADLRAWLLAQPAALLAGHLLEAAEQDDRLREKLLRAAARATDRDVDLSAYRRSLERATRADGFIDYRGAGAYADAVRDAMDPLRELLADLPDQAGAVIDVIEDALEDVEDALESADDSDGEIGGLLGELQELHFAACRVATPEPEVLARRLFKWELEGHWDVFYRAAQTYAEVLGDAGLAVYRRLTEAAWEKLPALAPGGGEAFDGTWSRVTSMMEALVCASGGDVDALAAIKAKNLSHAYDFLGIAELYRGAQRWDDVLAWAERGLAAFPKDTDQRLLEFLAAEYHRRGRHSDAMELAWRRFESRSTLETYRNLNTHAATADAGAWPLWRERALAFLRQPIARPAAPVPVHGSGEQRHAGGDFPLGKRSRSGVARGTEGALPWRSAAAGRCRTRADASRRCDPDLSAAR